MTMPGIPIRVFLLLCLLLPSSQGQCGTPGTLGQVPQLTMTSDLWDSTGELVLANGLPGAHWMLGVDLSPGPVTSPMGMLCLGFTPAFFVILDSTSGVAPLLGTNGSFAAPITIPPALSYMLGVPVYMQAVVFDPAAQAGIAISNDVTFKVKSPKVVVASVNVTPRTIDIFDGFALTTNPGAALLTSIQNQGMEDMALSPDGSVVYSRDVLVTTPNRVRAFDAQTTPGLLMAEATLGASSGGPARRGVVIDPTGAVGYFCDATGVQRFDADPASAGFMSVTGFATTTLQPPDGLTISPDGAYLYVVASSLSPGQQSVMMVIDTVSLTEIAVIPLTDSGSVLGITQRGPIEVSPSGDFVATLSLGFHLPTTGALSNSVLSIVHTTPGPTQFTEIAAVVLPRAFQDDLAFDPRDPTEARLYTVDSDQSNGTVYLTTIDWVAPSITSTFITAGSMGFIGEGGVDTTPDGSFIYMATSADDTLRVIDAASMTVLQSLSLPSAGTPNRLRVEKR